MKIEDGLPLNPLDEPVGTRVMRGLALLDEKVPGWRERVDPSRLDMTSDSECVLGQLFGTYPYGCQTLGIVTRVEATRYGFDATNHDGFNADDAGLDALTDAWRAVLAPSPA